MMPEIFPRPRTPLLLETSDPNPTLNGAPTSIQCREMQGKYSLETSIRRTTVVLGSRRTRSQFSFSRYFQGSSLSTLPLE